MPTVNYIWDPISDNILGEFDDNGNTIVEYTHEPGQHGRLVCQVSDGQTIHHHFDGDANTIALTNDSQSVTDTYGYSAFGEVAERAGSTTNSFGYRGAVGYYANPQSDDHYVRRRNYTASRARWLSADPLGTIFGANLYTYLSNRANGRIDPTGLADTPTKCTFEDCQSCVDSGWKEGVVLKFIN